MRQLRKQLKKRVKPPPEFYCWRCGRAYVEVKIAGPEGFPVRKAQCVDHPGEIGIVRSSELDIALNYIIQGLNPEEYGYDPDSSYWKGTTRVAVHMAAALVANVRENGYDTFSPRGGDGPNPLFS